MRSYNKRSILLTFAFIILLFFYINIHFITYTSDFREYENVQESYIDQSGIALAAEIIDQEDEIEQDKNKEIENTEKEVTPQPDSIEKKEPPEEKPVSPPEEKEHLTSEDSEDVDNKERYVLGFYVDNEYVHPGSYDRMMANSSEITAIAPFWYRLSPQNGSEIQEHHPDDGFTPQVIKDIVNNAHQKNIEVFMLVHNLLYGGEANGKELARQMLATTQTRKVFIDGVEALIKEYGYDGVNMDVENIYLDDRDKFSLLTKELYQRLDSQGYKVTVCIPAKTGDSRSNSWSGPFDYREIGRYSHLVAIMTYDEHGYSSGPGPIASYDWVRDVAKYAVTRIPPEKILLGIPGYGFDWEVGHKGPKYLSYPQAMEIADFRNAKIVWDDKSKVPYFKYWESSGQAHEVWFENANSLSHKLNIVNEFNIRGIAIWRLGLEDTEMWKVLESRIEAEK